ncbi:MAG: ATP-binding cassette domain-containing protein [Phycisphaeraceae bacterium]|nr:ATP-binding cassette domain-containing protein [Phycisphaeraceae bacterium]
MSDAIVLEDLTKTFGPKVAVDRVDLRIRQGTVCGFIGPNGAGKTTTIRMIMSILFPDSGRISVLGRPSAVESKDRIGYLPEERGVYRKMRVGAFLGYMARLKGVDGHVLGPKVRQWLDRVSLADCYKKRCEELSKGMQQKVQFLAAILHEPELIILDEVFSGLDPVNRRLMRELIDEQHRAGRTIIFSTHAMFEAEQLCDSVFMIHQGKKVLDAPVHDILSRYDPRSLLVDPVDREGARERLAALPGVRGVTLPEGSGAASRGIEVYLEDDVDPAGAITTVAQAIPVRRLEVKRASLEDVFIELVTASGAAAPSRAELQAGAPAEVAGV